MHADERDPSALQTTFSSAWSDVVGWEPDPESWRAEPELLADEPDGEPAWLEYDIPTLQTQASMSMDQWNLDALPRSPLRRTIALAAAFVPLMLGAEPVLAAPPPAETQAPPVENASPPAPSESEAMWKALEERHVVLTRHDESTFRGTVLSVADGSLVCARESDGRVVTIAITEVAFVQVLDLEDDQQPTKPPHQPGQAMIVFGSIATAIGGALTIAGAAVALSCASSSVNSYYGDVYICGYVSIPLGAVGLANLAAGIPLVTIGTRRRADARAAAQPTVSAFLAPGREGVMAGFGMRF